MLGVLYLFLLLVIIAGWRELRPTATDGRRRATLQVLDPARAPISAGERLALVSGATIGRESDNSIRLEEDSVSARHAALVQEGGRWWLEDMGSTNGSFVNEARVNGRAPLANGDTVRFGRVTARFVT